MRKLLYTTTALVGAAFLVQAAPAKAEVNISAEYSVKAIFGKFQLLEDGETKSKDLVNSRGSHLNDGAGVTFEASKDHPNGLTTGFKAYFDADNATDTGNEKNLMGDLYGSVGGSFGTVYIGNVGDGASHVFVGGTPGTANFGVTEGHLGDTKGTADNGLGEGNDIYGDAGIGTNATDDLIGREKSIKYASPSFTGFSFAASYTPETGKQGGLDAFDHVGDYNDAFGIGVAYSNEFAGTSISLSGSFAQTDAEVGAYNGPGTSTNEKSGVVTDTGATAGDFARAPATVTDDDTLAASVITAGKPAKRTDKKGSAFSFGAEVGYQDFKFGGSWGQREQGTAETDAWRAGGSYTMDAFTFGIAYGQEETQNGAYILTAVTGGDTNPSNGAAITAATIGYDKNAGAKVEEESLAFTVDYKLGDGANIDFGIEVDERTTTTGGVKRTTYDDTIFGVGVKLTF